MFSEAINHKQFPDFFTNKGSIQNNVLPLKMNGHTYWMSSLLTDNNSTLQRPYQKPYEDNEEGSLDCCDAEENYDIHLTKSGKFMTSLYIPSSLLCYVIGPRGFKLKKLQKNTNTLIKVPKPNESGEVKITGDTERNVASARTQLTMIVMQQKDKLPISHFVSIPVTSEGVKEKLLLFQKEVLKLNLRGVVPSIFQKPEKLHLTVCTLTLVDDEEVCAAKKVLQNFYDDILFNYPDRNKQYKLNIRGLEIMNDDPSEVNVLYCNVDTDDQDMKLQEIVDKISEHYYKAGLARKQYERVKLHVTLMNTSFKNELETCKTFDATYILDKFRNYDFGSVKFDNIHLSIRFTSGENKYYECALCIQF